MKRIQKGSECKALSDWRTANATVPQNLAYGKGGFPVEQVLEALLTEQGHLCAYTLKLIDTTSAHIEHLKPQQKCRKEDRQRNEAGLPLNRGDVAWNNMVACFPEPGAPRPAYGAVEKDDWWPEDGLNGFVSPLDRGCEARFLFELSGEMKPANAADTAADQTIKKVGLDDSRLRELRRTAFLKMGLHLKSERPLQSAAEVRRLIAAWNQRDANNKFKEFCVPLRAVALRHLAMLEGRTNRGAT